MVLGSRGFGKRVEHQTGLHDGTGALMRLWLYLVPSTMLREMCVSRLCLAKCRICQCLDSHQNHEDWTHVVYKLLDMENPAIEAPGAKNSSSTRALLGWTG